MNDPFSFKPNLDMTKIMAEFRLPAMPDMTELAKAQQKNLEAITAANKVALEGARAVAERHMEIVQQSVAEMQTDLGRMGCESNNSSAIRLRAFHRDILQSFEMKGGWLLPLVRSREPQKI